MAERGITNGKHGAVAVIQRANSDLRCNPHVHAIFLDDGPLQREWKHAFRSAAATP
jgi:hypothetical protein